MEMLAPARPDIVSREQRSGLYEFVHEFWAAIAQRVSSLCAAGGLPAHRGSGGSGLPGQPREKNEGPGPESAGKRVEMED